MISLTQTRPPLRMSGVDLAKPEATPFGLCAKAADQMSLHSTTTCIPCILHSQIFQLALSQGPEASNQRLGT